MAYFATGFADSVWHFYNNIDCCYCYDNDNRNREN